MKLGLGQSHTVFPKIGVPLLIYAPIYKSETARRCVSISNFGYFQVILEARHI